MADNVAITAGSGTTIATDDVAGIHVQYVKLMDGTLDGSGKIAGDATNGLDVDVTRLPALVAGTANIGDVDVLTVPAPLSTTGNGTAATALRVTLASDSTGTTAVTQATASSLKMEPAGNVAHDAGDSGNPVKVGGRAISDLAAATMVAAADRTDLMTDLDGVMLVHNHCPLGNILSERVSDTGGTSTALSTFGATASTRNFISMIVVHNAHASTNGFVDIRDGTAGSVLMTIPLPAAGGAVIPLNPPLRQPTANTALAYDVSAAITTVYLTFVGFKSKA